MIQLFEKAILKKDIPETPFKKGDIGIVVELNLEKQFCVLEFFALDDSTLGVATVSLNDIISTDGVKYVMHVDL